MLQSFFREVATGYHDSQRRYRTTTTSWNEAAELRSTTVHHQTRTPFLDATQNSHFTAMKFRDACCYASLLIRPTQAFTQPREQHNCVQRHNVIQRRPRRSLEKRRKRRDNDGIDHEKADDFPWDSAESRPMVPSLKKELGEDYWVDEDELARYQAKLVEQRQRDPGQIPEEKLWIEVLSPYKDNWIGLISVSIVALSFIFKVRRFLSFPSSKMILTACFYG